MTELAPRQQRLVELEAIVEVDMAAFLRVGNALLEIRRDNLWKEWASEDGERTYPTFANYLESRWPTLQKSQLYRNMSAAYITGHLESSPTGEFLPTNEGQARPLTRLGTLQKHEMGKVTERVWQEAWEKAVELAGGQPTENHVKQAVDKILTAENDEEVEIEAWSGRWELDNIYQADTTTMQFADSMPEAKAHMLFTDPPWDKASLLSYEAAGRLAHKVLVPGGYCFIYAGKMFLPEIMSLMGKWLDYAWTFAVYQPDNNQTTRGNGLNIFEAWRPILAFKKPGVSAATKYVPDSMRCTRDKNFHKWGQGPEPIEKYIDAVTRPGQVVIDTYVGGGVVPAMAQKLNRRYIGFDKDAEAVRITKLRLMNGR